ncbi:MAG: M48 family metalloprotease [Vulcanimicrobiaceae bacterium]
MLLCRARPVLAMLLLAALASFVPNCAQAALARPNALDRRVDAIAVSALLHDPATALVDPDRQGAAQRLAEWTLPGWLLSILVQAALLAYFWRSGYAARLRDALHRRLRSAWAVRFAFGALLALLAKLASAIPDFYLYRIDRIMGITSELARTWALAWCTDTLISMLAVGMLIAVVLWLVDRTHQWYIYTALGIVFISIAVAYLTPYVRSFGNNPSEPVRGALAMRLQQLEKRAGASIPIYVETGSNRSQVESALVEGLGNSVRLVLSDTLLAGESSNEVAFAVAYQLGYVREHDPLKRALYDALLVILGTALAVFVADRIGFRRDDNELSRMALVGALLSVAYLAVVPIDHAISKSMTIRADRYAMSLTHDRAAAVRALVRQTDQGLGQVCPNIITRTFLERTPSAGVRIAAINGIRNDCP